MSKQKPIEQIEHGTIWAPDNCPPGVIKLIEDEQYLEDMGLRGLASSDSAELHQAVRKLKAQLSGAFEAGTEARRPYPPIRTVLVRLVMAAVVGGICGAWLQLVLGP